MTSTEEFFNAIVGFLKDIRAGNTNAAGILADYLEEHGDPRGKLVRRRWKRWQKDYANELEFYGTAENRYFHSTGNFILYLREKFPQESYESTDPMNTEAYWAQ